MKSWTSACLNVSVSRPTIVDVSTIGFLESRQSLTTRSDFTLASPLGGHGRGGPDFGRGLTHTYRTWYIFTHIKSVNIKVVCVERHISIHGCQTHLARLRWR